MDDLIADNVGNIGGGGSPFFKENGNYQATHAINMAFKKLLNLSTPSEPFEAATKNYVDNKDDDMKKYVDDKDDDMKKYVEDRSHVIAINARYSGKLLKGKYKFAFAGNATDYDDDRLGFAAPYIGFIRHVEFRITLYDIFFFFFF